MDAAPPITELLPPEVLDGLGGLDLAARTIVRGLVAGGHRSPFLGSGEDFSRHRAYQQGDDVRRLDWRLYGRTDRLYVRLFEERSNLQAMILVDATASMSFAGANGVSKLRYAQFLAAASAHLMLGAGDAVGLASFGSGVRFHLPPRSRPGQRHDLLLALQRLAPDGAGETHGALGVVGSALSRRSRLVLISDCLDDDAERLRASVGRLRARGDEVIVLRVATEEELGLVPPGPARFFDPEAPSRVVEAAPADDPDFADRVDAWYGGLRRDLEEQGAEFVPLLTSTPLVTAMREWLLGRSPERGRTP